MHSSVWQENRTPLCHQSETQSYKFQRLSKQQTIPIHLLKSPEQLKQSSLKSNTTVNNQKCSYVNGSIPHLPPPTSHPLSVGEAPPKVQQRGRRGPQRPKESWPRQLPPPACGVGAAVVFLQKGPRNCPKSGGGSGGKKRADLLALLFLCCL